ncbi:hypothetical protein V3C99_003136 [Haemonchus contortus]
MSTESHSHFAMRSRVGRTLSDQERRKDSLLSKDAVIIERKIKAGDTLNKIAIQYSVNVSDIKRVNNLVSDQDFIALTVVKIPVSRLRYALGVSSSSEDDEHIIDFDERACLLENEKSKPDTRNTPSSQDASVDDIFHRTDTMIVSAQVREALPEGGLPGSFHFVDARPPDTACSVWTLVALVVITFMVVPLLLTYYEEHVKEDAS